jgi:Uma2 family endonuclease
MALVNVQPRRFNRQDYYRLAETGFFKPGERVELIDGELVTMTAHNLPHANAISYSNMLLTRQLGASHFVRAQLPITLSDDCEPEPDFALVTLEHMQACNREGNHPSQPDLVIEVSDCSLSYDRGEKAGLYARAGIAEYWILNVVRRCLEQRREPQADPDAFFGHSYRSIRIFSSEEQVSPWLAPEVQLPVSELLGPIVIAP